MTAENKDNNTPAYTVKITLNNEQLGERQGRLIAVITREPEKINLGYPEESRGKVSSMRWRNFLECAISMVFAITVGISGTYLINHGGGEKALGYTDIALGASFLLYRSALLGKKDTLIGSISQALSKSTKTVYQAGSIKTKTIFVNQQDD